MTEAVQQEQEQEQEFSDAFAEAAKAKQGSEEPIAEDPPADPPTPAEVVGGGDDDPYAGLPADAVERIKAAEAERDQLQHRISSDDGRVGALQRKINTLEKQLNERPQAPAATPAPAEGEQPSADEINDAMQSDESWAEFSTEYPDIAEAIDARLQSEMAARLNSHQAELDSRLSPVMDKFEQDSLNQGYDALEEKHPGWRERITTDEFSSWLEQQPEAVQKWADSDDVNEASSLIGYYDQYLLATGQGTPAPANSGSGNHQPANTLESRRAQQLEDGQTVPSSGAGITTDGPDAGDEFSRSFQAEARRREMANRANAR